MMNDWSASKRLDDFIDMAAQGRIDRAAVERTIVAFAKRIGLPDFAFDADGPAAVVTVGDDLEIILARPDGMPGVVAAALMDLEPDAAQRLAPDLLKLNAQWLGSGAGVFVRLPPDGGVALCRKIVILPDDDGQLEQDLLAFAEEAAVWVDTLDGLAESLEQAPAPVPPLRSHV